MLVFLVGCQVNQATSVEGESICRLHHQEIGNPPPPHYCQPPRYPWEHRFAGQHPRITKEFFRCHGCCLNPPLPVQRQGRTEYIADCGGARGHSLPVRDEQEEIYPILIELLNYVQEQTGHRVIITCGHRCPTHNTYADDSQAARTSKHLIGAEVDFYVEGLEWEPEVVIALLQDYYRDQEGYEYFERYYKSNTNVSTPPWYNKEVFVKLFKVDEGRDGDNNHAYPYVSIQVRYDRQRQKRVSYTWEAAFHGYRRN